METRFEIVTTPDAFSALEPAWNELISNHPLDHAFMRHQWFACWLKHLARGGHMCFVTAWHGSRLVAAAPMQASHTKIKHIPARVLTFASSTITPRCNIITAPDYDHDRFYEYLFRLPGIDLIITPGLERDADATGNLCRFLNQTARPSAVEIGRRSPFLTTGGTWDSFHDSLAKSFRTILRRGNNKLARTGETCCRKVEQYAELKRLLPELVDISAHSWKAGEATDLGSLPQVVAFLDDFSRLGEPDRLWELWVLYLNNRPIAFDYYLRGPSSLSLIRTDFHLDYKDLSPGNNIQQAVLRDLFDREGVWEYDMGGQAYDYKLKWTDKIRTHIDLWASGSRPWGKLLMFGKRRIIPFFRESIPDFASETG